MPTPPSFGKRGLKTTAPAPPPPRRWRSDVVVIGAVGALALTVAAAAEWRDHRCRPRAPDDPDPRPHWCDSTGGSHSSGYYSGGHGYGFSSGGGESAGSSHASFGGFGAHGSGHGGGE